MSLKLPLPLPPSHPPPLPVRRTGGTDWMSAIGSEQKHAIEDALHIAAESKEHGLVQALGKFMKAMGESFKSMSP